MCRPSYKKQGYSKSSQAKLEEQVSIAASGTKRQSSDSRKQEPTKAKRQQEDEYRYKSVRTVEEDRMLGREDREERVRGEHEDERPSREAIESRGEREAPEEHRSRSEDSESER